ncbi:DEAD/DEAH box helicase [Mycoplasmoides gallisepticum]
MSKYINEGEHEFENLLVEKLTEEYGWKLGNFKLDEKDAIIKYPDEKRLINNWRDILNKLNKGHDRLNGRDLDDDEMNKIYNEFKSRTPYEINLLFNGGSINITRTDGSNVSLILFHKNDIGGGSTVYQIVRQPQFKGHNGHRGDLQLLINGIPLIHIELKDVKRGENENDKLSKAFYQIKNYYENDNFNGLFKCIQIFVTMTPNKTRYFANPGSARNFEEKFWFKWTDAQNKEITDWKEIAKEFLSIPIAHNLIAHYTIPDKGSESLKIVRPYQYHAIKKVLDKVIRVKKNGLWDKKLEDDFKSEKSCHVWHTTGSGKTLTSYKLVELIYQWNKDGSLADKVVFVADRIELIKQTLIEYKSFSPTTKTVQGTYNTDDLFKKLISSSRELIVTSIYKLSKLSNLNEFELPKKILDKRIVFVVDECHRSTFDKMFKQIRQVFNKAIFIGFTGTPILNENKKNDLTTYQIFGEEIHNYKISNAIADESVLKIDTYSVYTINYEDIISKIKRFDPNYQFPDEKKERYEKVEKFLVSNKDESPFDHQHRKIVVSDIRENWKSRSDERKFHAILTVPNIDQAIEYYKLFIQENNDDLNLNVTAIFDPNFDTTEEDDKYDYHGNKIAYESKVKKKEDAIKLILANYHKMFSSCDEIFRYLQHEGECSLDEWDKFKEDVQLRLAHKDRYKYLTNDDSKIDLVIVVNQLLTGYDSKYINTLYLDRRFSSPEQYVQAISRTNRVLNDQKQMGQVVYYRLCQSVKEDIEKAFDIYSNENIAQKIFISDIENNIAQMNEIFSEIKKVFESTNIKNFSSAPQNKSGKRKFVNEFNKLDKLYRIISLQLFNWETWKNKDKKQLDFDQEQYLTLEQRYKEIADEVINDPDEFYVPIELSLVYKGSSSRETTINLKFLFDNKNTLTKQDAYNMLSKNITRLSIEDQEIAKVVFNKNWDDANNNLLIENTVDFWSKFEAEKNARNDAYLVQQAKSLGCSYEALKALVDKYKFIATEDINVNNNMEIEAFIKTYVNTYMQIHNILQVFAEAEMNAKILDIIARVNKKEF